MKNILAENMLRFGVKNLQESDIKTIVQLSEQTPNDTNIASSVTVTGATPSNTSTVTAASELKKVTNVKRINGTVTEEISLTKSANGLGSIWNVTPKTLSAKHYIIIGNRKVIGDGGKPGSITIKFREYLDNPVEVCGNGIFAVGRLLNAYNKGELGAGSTVVIGLNLPTPNTFKLNIDLNEHDPILNFASDAVASLIGLSVIKDNTKFNNTQELQLGRNFKQKGTAGTLINIGAVPRISSGNVQAERAALMKIDPIDASNFELKNKEINVQKPDDAFAALNQFIDQYWPIFAKTYATRLKSWVNGQAIKNNLDPNAFATVNDSINKWIATQKIQSVRDNAEARIRSLIQPLTRGAATPNTGTVSGTKTIKGKEGSLSQ